MRQPHTRLQLCKRCVAAARQRTGSDSSLPSLLNVGFRRERRYDLFKLRIAPQWFPQRMKFEMRVVNVTRYRHEFLKHFDRAIVFTFDRFIRLDLGFEFDSFRSNLKRPGENQRHRKAEDDDDDNYLHHPW